MDENTHSSFKEINPEEIEKALYEAKKLIADHPKKIHMTFDFYQRLRASPLVEIKKAGSILEMGMPIEIHTEPCEKEYWFDYQDNIKNAAYGWHYDEKTKTLHKAILVNTTTT